MERKQGIVLIDMLRFTATYMEGMAKLLRTQADIINEDNVEHPPSEERSTKSNEDNHGVAF